MPPLTLEQVLARSMRLPRQRARQSMNSLFGSSSGGGGVGVGGAAPVTTISSSSGGGVDDVDAAAARRETPARRFIDMVEREEAARRAARVGIRTGAALGGGGAGPSLVHTSDDLTTYLRTAARVGGWEDGWRAFLAATGTEVVGAADAAAADGRVTLRRRGGGAEEPVGAITPTAAHLAAVAALLAGAERWGLLAALAEAFGLREPSVVVAAAEAMAAHAPGFTLPPGLTRIGAPPKVKSVLDAGAADGGGGGPVRVQGWERAFHFLQGLPFAAAAVPVEAYNACLLACGSDWVAVLHVLRAMGPSPLQAWTCPEETTARAARGLPPVVPRSAADAGTPLGAPPPPDIVGYATLFAALEQSRMERLSAVVLQLLPPTEREEITASYAALIYVWSNQVLSKQRRRF